MQYDLSQAPLYPPGLGDFFKQLGTSHAFMASGKEVLFGVLFIFLFFYLIVSAVLFYHWAAYGMRNKYIIFAEITFTAVSAFLFWTAFILITTI